MPNWCSNKLTVTGPTAALTEFIAATTDTDGQTLRFGKLVPVPEPETFDAVDKWGTKWEAAYPDMNPVEKAQGRPGHSTVTWWFDTAWAPPLNWAYAASALYPTLDFQLWYDEPGMDFAGLEHIVGNQKQPDSWEGESLSFTTECTAAGCMNDIEGVFPWDITEENPPRRADYCRTHDLATVVAAATTAGTVDTHR